MIKKFKVNATIVKWLSIVAIVAIVGVVFVVFTAVIKKNIEIVIPNKMTIKASD